MQNPNYGYRGPIAEMPSPPPAGYDNQDIGNYPSPIGNTNGFNGHGDGYRSPPPGFNGNNAYQQPRSPAPPYADQSSNRFFGPDSFQSPHEKPIGGAPIVYGMQNGMEMPVIGTPPTDRRICGIRRRYFWIILILIILIFLAGLGAGLGIALGKKKNGSGSSQADQLAAGAGTSTTIPTTSASSTSVGGIVVHTVPPASNTPVANTPTSEFTTPEQTPTPEESSPTPEPTTPDYTTPDYTTPEPTTPPPEPTTPPPEPTTPPPQPTTPDPTTPDPTTPEPTTPEPTTPEPTTPEPTSPEPTSPEPTSPEGSTPGPSTPPAPTAFTLEDGYNTLTLTVGSTIGNLCPYIANAIQVTTTVYVSISGDESDPYTAVWKLDNYPATLTATGAPQKTGSFDAWGFEVPINSDINGCSWQGGDVFALGENAIAGYASGSTLQNQCRLGTYVFSAGSSCTVYWVGSYST